MASIKRSFDPQFNLVSQGGEEAKKTKQILENKAKASKPKIKKSLQKSKFGALIELTVENNPGASEERNSKHKPLDLLILLILNQSTTDLLSDLAFLQMKKDYPNYESILTENNPKKLTESIKICGLAPTKANYILNTLHYLFERGWLDLSLKFIEKMNDEQALKELTKIKGVGIKSASCLLMFSFGRNVFPIDTHLFRILKRVGGILPPKTTTEQAHKLLQPQIIGDSAFVVHVGLIELGRKICLAQREPLCKQCYLQKICDFGQEKLA